jgi:putative ABC transport system permease protein
VTRHTSDRWLRLGGRLLPPVYRAEILTDLVEERDAMRAQGRGRVATTLWMLGHLGRSAVASRRQSARGRRSPLRGVAVGRELRQAARSLRKAPWYAVTIVAVTALSMALATTVFAVVDGVLFKPLPYPNPEELYVVSARYDETVEPSGRGVETIAVDELAAWSAHVPDAAFTGYSSTSVPFPDGTHARAAVVHQSFFDVFGVRVLMGGFREEHFAADMPVRPIVISHRLWQDRFGGDVNVLGTIVEPFAPWFTPSQVVGVLAPGGFVPPWPGSSAVAERRDDRIDALIPLGGDFGRPSVRDLIAFARVPAGRFVETETQLRNAVRAAYESAPALPSTLSRLQRRSRAAFESVDFVPLSEYTSARERPALALVFGTVMSLVCLVLLNAGALSVARAHQRVRDLSLRRALGARTRDLIRHALAEQGILAGPGKPGGSGAGPQGELRPGVSARAPHPHPSSSFRTLPVSAGAVYGFPRNATPSSSTPWRRIASSV